MANLVCQLDTPGKRELQLGNCLIRLACGRLWWHSSWFLTDGGRPGLLWVTPSLSRVGLSCVRNVVEEDGGGKQDCEWSFFTVLEFLPPSVMNCSL